MLSQNQKHEEKNYLCIQINIKTLYEKQLLSKTYTGLFEAG